MSQCYSVCFRYKLKPNADVKKKLADFLNEDKEKAEDYFEYVLCYGEGNGNTVEEKGGFTCMISDFNASYGWESVLYGMFRCIETDLEDGSSLSVYPDSGNWTIGIRGGKLEEIRNAD